MGRKAGRRRRRCLRPSWIDSILAVATLLLVFVVVSLPSGTIIPTTHGFVVHNDLPRPATASYDSSSKRRRCHHYSPRSAGSRRRKIKRHGTTGLATGIFSSSNNKIDDVPTTTTTTTTTTTKGPLDAALTWLISDTGSVLLGSVGLIALLVGRLLGDDTNNIDDNNNDAETMVATTRETLLAVVAIGAVLLNGLSQLDVPTALAETVVLDGVNVPTARVLLLLSVPSSSLSSDTTTSSTTSTSSSSSSMAMTASSSTTTTTNNLNIVAWVLESLVQASPAALSAVYLVQRPQQRQQQSSPSSTSSCWEIVGGVGILPSDLLVMMTAATAVQQKSTPEPKRQRPIITVPAPTPILDRFLVVNNNNNNNNDQKKKVIVPQGESYLPTLQALPGKVEFFSYLPRNTQAVLVLSCGGGGVVANDHHNNNASSVGVVVVGSNRARSFTPRDIAWCRAAVSRLSSSTT